MSYVERNPDDPRYWRNFGRPSTYGRAGCRTFRPRGSPGFADRLAGCVVHGELREDAPIGAG